MNESREDVVPPTARTPLNESVDSGFSIQRRASKVITLARSVAELSNGRITHRDRKTLAVTRTISVGNAQSIAQLSPESYAVLLSLDGAARGAPRLLVFGNDDEPARYRVYTGAGDLIGAEVPTELWIVTPEGATRERAGERLETVDSITWSSTQFEAVCGLADGSLISGVSGGLLRSYVRSPARHYDMPIAPWHLSAAGPERVWATDLQRRLVMIQLGPTVALVHTHDLAPGQPIHMHSTGDLAAVLLGERDAARIAYSLVVYDGGKLRWRAPVPTTDQRILYVTTSVDRIIVSGPGVFYGWDAASGRLVTS